MKLTLPQQDIYFDQILHPNEPIYNIGAKIEIRGVINNEIFNNAFTALIDQHDAYRTVLVKNDEEVSAKITEGQISKLGFVDFSHSEKPVEEAVFYMQKQFKTSFDLFNESPLYNFTLVKVQEDFHYLFSVYHHIITDGWGTSLMFQRLVQNYNEITDFGSVQTLYPFTYTHFAEDDYNYKNSPSFTEDLNYWKQKFKTLPENLLDKLDDGVQINKSSRKKIIIKREVYNELNHLALDYKCSSFHLILGILYTYFARNYEKNDITIGLPVLNRGKSVYKKTVGLFMGVSPLRIAIDFETTFHDLIVEIKNELKKDYRHQRLPLGKLIQHINSYGEKERIFNLTLSYEKQNYSSHFHNTITNVIPLSHESERVALAVYIREFDDLEDVIIDFDYNLNYFDEVKIDQFANHFECLLHDVLINSDKKIKDLNYLTQEERKKVVLDFNETKVEYSKNSTFLDLFKEHTATFPEKLALFDDINSYSYSQLDKLSNQIAEILIIDYGTDDKSAVAVLLDRSALMVAVLIGIMKSGRSYIPLDPFFPKERLSYIVDNSKANIIIKKKDYEIEGKNVVDLDTILDKIKDTDVNKLKAISSQDTAYIIYTSGSTGNPKGVEISHKSLLNFLISIQNKPGINSRDLLFSVTTYSFDISILEFFVPLISGAAVYIANQKVLSDPELIIEKLTDLKPTVVQATPSFYQMLFNAGWYGDKQLKVLCGGDLLSEALAEKLLSHSLELWNMYGPTETTIWSSSKKINSAKESGNIGKPINNTQFYIVDKFLNPKPVGSIGAIYIGGDGLAKGYYQNSKLTAEKFVNNPFNDQLFYETGDVGKWNELGEIEFLGRNDNQVKIRGYRIELGDIEFQLNQIEEIVDAVVIAKKKEQQEAFLVAYVLEHKKKINTEYVISELKKHLPYYMIPMAVIPVKEFPLTPNQKIDRKSLTQRDIEQNINQDDFKAPVSHLEKKISEFWKEVLNINTPLSITNNFFSLGGHSLNAVKLIGLISKNLSLTITLKTIFDYPTIEALGGHLSELKPGKLITIPSAELKEFYTLTPSQYNIWLASQQKKYSIAYNMSAAYNIEGALNLDKIRKSINNIIDKHEILRTNFIEIDGIPYQKINDFEKEKFEISLAKIERQEIKQYIDTFISTEFDLEKDLLLRVKLLQLDEEEFIILFSVHHIIMDGLSLEIFIKEFITYYNENNTEKIAAEKKSNFQFKDYSEWLNREIESNSSENKLFWNNYLHNYSIKDSFDKDFEKQQNQHALSQHSFELTADLTLVLKELALAQQVTLYTFLVTALNVLIYKFSRHRDICIGTVSSGRNVPALTDLIGMFAQTAILRTQILPGQIFSDLLKNTQRDLLEIDHYGLGAADQMKLSVFDLMLVYQNPEFSFDSINDFTDFKLTSYAIEHKFSRMPIVINCFENDNKLKGIIDYNSDLFEQSTIDIIASKFCSLLEEISNDPFIKLDLITLKSELEKTISFDFDF
ncbi:non-ribosomal peptide synthetase [[Flexibacter] sp. ATCC 35103]|uniref:non-ribosomal peptide synthetase n=1 Tax=[Flexibacter] sp. ATCC 35103 TaxID=1937528 RepID=UPI0009C1AD3C|nr:non-ribosomal peptide synthetase [[Flexibacter] sp. ATCC 35103]AQX14477.1 monobactam NRPS scaffold 1 [[Flexibacter] sp. ATCC 35103]OMQ08259.1 non-ribosomal peptide synthetase [[Flexibacter] sp. ATCC 35103]